MNTKAFTLIEMIVVITIMMILMMMTYVPYSHHQKKTVLIQGAREISQSLTEARNLAIHGLDTGSGNVSVGLFFASGATQIEYYIYPFDEYMDISNLGEKKLYKIKKLPPGIQVDSMGGLSDGRVVTFDAISGSGNILGYEFPVQISFKGAITPVLQKQILYYPQSYISDY